MPVDPYYQSDLAWVHHSGYAHHAERVGPGIVRLLRDAGLGSSPRVLDVGCGSGLLARALRAEGFAVIGIDASAAMIELARGYEPSAQFEVVRLPTRKPPGTAGALPTCDAVVSTGHVLNYLDTRAEVAQALGELARAVRPGGLLAIDLMTERYCDRPDLGQVHAKVQDDWAIIARFSRPEPYRFDRAIAVFRREGTGLWRRSDEHHRNITFEPDEALRILRDNGINACLRGSFADESLPDGLAVLSGTSSKTTLTPHRRHSNRE
jgi:SAM-dependent methyltransferase